MFSTSYILGRLKEIHNRIGADDDDWDQFIDQLEISLIAGDDVFLRRIKHIIKNYIGDTKRMWVRCNDYKLQEVRKDAALINGHWIAFSQLALDEHKNIYIKKWLYDKIFCA